MTFVMFGGSAQQRAGFTIFPAPGRWTPEIAVPSGGRVVYKPGKQARQEGRGIFFILAPG